jgi:L-asparaginase
VPDATAPLPHVHLVATGGTIAVAASGLVDAADLVAAVPRVAKIATLTVEDFINIGSSRITPEIQLRLASRINEMFASNASIAGIVVTHGTDTLEETAFFLDLLVADPRPVLFTAAQRPPRAPDSDGPQNLLDAVRVACSPDARNMGVLVTLNGEIHAARQVRKTHATALDAFKSPGTGPIGNVTASSVRFTRHGPTRLTLKIDSVEPSVDLLTLVAGSDGRLVMAAVDSGARGIVIEVFGSGNVPPSVMDAVRAARSKGIVVVFTTRTGGGSVHVDDEARALGVVSGKDLDGLKSRMLLVAALSRTRDPSILQTYFDQLAGDNRQAN